MIILTSIPFEIPVKDIQIHTEGINTSDWIIVDPEANPKNGDKVLIKDTNRLVLLTYLWPYYFSNKEHLFDMALYDLLGTVIQKNSNPVLGENIYVEVNSD